MSLRPWSTPASGQAVDKALRSSTVNLTAVDNLAGDCGKRPTASYADR